VDERGVPPPKISVWGHSWGSYVSSELAKRSGGNVKALVGLDPAETLVGPDPDDTKTE